ncbi:excalibur calcium-binding domain-containing protein [Micromonospora sp. CPCC 206061]|uniref:excalibur calcium-binding domain-containing protein n=1 Tax=Micromonospora sp. CPCC 206061 TaxID=3122410 RepID=UPI002FF1CE5B
MTPSRSQATSRPSAPVRKAVNHRRVWFFTIALLLALAFGAAMFKAVFAGPPPTADGPARPAPATTSPATSPPSTLDKPARDNDANADAPAREGAAPDKEPQAPPASEPRPAPTTPKATPDTVAVHYKNCGQARKAGAAPIERSDAGYDPALDKDGDGIACEAGQS